MCRTGLALLVVLFPAIAVAQGSRTPRDMTIAKTTSPGQTVRIRTYTPWHRDCTPDTPPRIVIRTPPAHGTTRIEPGSVMAREVSEGAPDCTGRVMPGTAIFYVPAPGFTGTDQFQYDVVETHTTHHDTAVVTIR